MPFFVEVGVCDFDTCEQLIQNGWKGLMIEPIAHYFNNLKKYPDIHYENIAVSDISGETEMHFINPEIIVGKSNQWLKGISSINGKGCFSYNKDKPLFKNCKKQKVKTYTLNYLCEKYNIKNIDFLKIDTEGHDFHVLKSIDLNRIYVKMIKIEHKHINHTEVIEYLKARNYIVYMEKEDMYAIK